MGDTPGGSLGICPKCKERPAEFTVRKNYTSCFPCLEALLSLKLKVILKGRGGVGHKEHIAVAFSGGSSSSLMLEFMKKFRDPQAGPYDKQKMAFDLSVFHIAVNDENDDGAVELVEAIAKRIINEDPDITYRSVPLADLYSQEATDPSLRQAMLADLLASVIDSTGRDDLISYLKTMLLLQLCKEAGCKKMIVGYNAAAFAIRAIASAVKGAGYALPSDAQHVDSRHASTGDATIIYPMKDLTDEEIDVVCRVLDLPCSKKTISKDIATEDGQPVVPALATEDIDKHNINALAALFVENVLKHNPGAVHNINSTISRLEAFPWNVTDSSSSEPKFNARASADKKADAGNGNAEVLVANEAFCPLCCAPLADDEVCSAITIHRGPLSGVCDSCRHQIFGATPAAADGGGDVLQKLPRCVVKNIEQTSIMWNKVSSSDLAGEEQDAEFLRRSFAAAQHS